MPGTAKCVDVSESCWYTAVVIDTKNYLALDYQADV